MRVRAQYGGEGKLYTFDAPEGTQVGDELSQQEDGGGQVLVVAETGSDYKGETRQLYPRAEMPEPG